MTCLSSQMEITLVTRCVMEFALTGAVRTGCQKLTERRIPYPAVTLLLKEAHTNPYGA